MCETIKLVSFCRVIERLFDIYDPYVSDIIKMCIALTVSDGYYISDPRVYLWSRAVPSGGGAGGSCPPPIIVGKSALFVSRCPFSDARSSSAAASEPRTAPPPQQF